MKTLSEYYSNDGDKRSTVTKTFSGYKVSTFDSTFESVKEKLFENSFDAEDYAEDFVMGEVK